MTERKRSNRYKSYLWKHPRTKKLYARVQIKQDDGTFKTYLKAATSKKHAEQLAEEMLADYAVRKTGFVEGEAMTFSEFAEWYKDKYCIAPIYSEDGTKVSGMRTFETVGRRIDALKLFFGNILIKNIDEDVLFRYRRKREKENKATATINRDFEILRAMFRKAVRRRWLRESPFDFGERLIEKAMEKRRSVILTDEQEKVLLRILREREKTLIYYAFLCLLETGARPSEIYDASTIEAEPVKWNFFFDYDFKAVKLVSYKGRQKLIRYAPVTNRLETAMRELWNLIPEADRDVKSQIFPVSSFKRAWGNVRQKADHIFKIAAKNKMTTDEVFALEKDDPEKFAELKKEIEKLPLVLDLRLRDLRRNFSTRLANSGMENDLRQRILGHEQAQTTFDYTEADLQTALVAKKMLDGDIIEIKSENN